MSGYTQLGAAPGSQPQEVLPGNREFEPVGPTQANNVGLDPDGSLDLTNPDGSPHDTEADVLNELQRVQRDIASRRRERMKRQSELEQRLALACQELQREIEEDNKFHTRMDPLMGTKASRIQ